jgi:hypothetical protein
LPYLGVLQFSGENCVGGAEFVPSREVPYAIPKTVESAFLTCSYLSDPVTDYKSRPLEVLEESLKELGFSEIVAIASEEVVFPNGTLKWFSDRNYEDLGIVYDERESFALMHLVRKKLS